MSQETQFLGQQASVAYFSMEIGLEAALPTYSGGLGVLAGDTLRAAADLEVPMVAVSLLHRKGYFRQKLDEYGNQFEGDYDWSPEKFLEPLNSKVAVSIEGRTVWVRAWRYHVRGAAKHTVPVLLLDTALPENAEYDQTLTDHLYGGDSRYRLCQETILGFGGVAVLRALGYNQLQTYHMNEGHSSLLTVALLAQRIEGRPLHTVTQEDQEAVAGRCVFTTHTPVPAGHDKFPLDLVRQVLGPDVTEALDRIGGLHDGMLNMTHLALVHSRYVNGVSMRHEQISRHMFPNYPVNSVTNGVHSWTWASDPFRKLFNQYFPEWRHDNRYLRNAVSISLREIQDAHGQAKRDLLQAIEQRQGVRLDPTAFTIGFARRATTYKRADLLFSDLERLKRIASNVGPIQVVYGGKAHPHDEGGKALIRRIFQAAASLGDAVRVVYVEEYDMDIARYICSGIDLWLNNPQKPHEASGTSGMKASLNGVPNLSVQDGWWIEGCVEGVTGWAVGDGWETASDIAVESESIYDKLEHIILPMYYNRPASFASIMRSSISLNGSFFNAQRMVSQYLENAYRIPG